MASASGGFLVVLEAGRLRSRCGAGLAPPEASVLGVPTANFSSPLTWSSPVALCPLLSSCKDTSPTGLGPSLNPGLTRPPLERLSPQAHTVRHRGRNSADESGDRSVHKGGPGGEIPGRKPHWADAREGKTRAGVSETCHAVQFSEILTSWEKPQTFCSLWKTWGHEQGGDWNHKKKDYRQGLLI